MTGGADTRANAGRPPRWQAALAWLWLPLLIAASFWSLDLQWAAFLTPEALAGMGRFVAEFFPPDLGAAFLGRVLRGAWETLAMSAVGTALAAIAGLALALPVSRTSRNSGQSGPGWARLLALAVANGLRAVPELVWAALLVVAAGLGPLAGTLALAMHTAGVLARLFAQALETAPTGPAHALRAQGASAPAVLAFAELPQVLPVLISYTLYRWENNIRAATVLGVVGAGGLGQLLLFHLSLFHMPKVATVLLAMLALVLLVDAASHGLRRWWVE